MTPASRLIAAVCLALAVAGPAWADPPVLAYLFPAGGQRGTDVTPRLGGLHLHSRCGVELFGPGVTAERHWKSVSTKWFEGPILPLPESQQQEDYPKDVAGTVRIAADAPAGVRPVRIWTSQGAASGFGFVVGELPEVVERELPGDPVAEPVTLPVTANGRIFPREDVDAWSFAARKGESVTAELLAESFGSPLEAHLEVLDAAGRRLAESAGAPATADALVRFTAPADGTYQVRVRDQRALGGPAYVYRLTLTAGPYVDRAFPLGGRRGESVAFELVGQNLPAGPQIMTLPKDGPAEFRHAFAGANAVRLDLDDLPELREPAATPAALPAVMNGRVAAPGETDVWPVELKKDGNYVFELRAHRLGSPLTGVLTLTDPAGKEVARADALADNQPDPVVRFRPAADGTYRLAVADRFRSRGGPAFAYRLRAATQPADADFRLLLGADTLSVFRGKQAKFRVNVERIGGFNGPVALAFDGLPAGVSVFPSAIPAGQPGADLTVSALPPAAIGAGRLVTRGTAAVGGKDVTRTAVVPAARWLPRRDDVLLAVALPTPFRVESEYLMSWGPRGSVYARPYRIERNGFAGPIEVRLADRQARHLQGVTGPTLTLAPGEGAVSYPIQMPPWMETGRTCRVCVMATGTVREPDGSEHEVSFSSVEQNHQVIVVVEPGRLGLEADRTSVRVAPGSVARIALRVARGKGLGGPVKVGLVVPEHWHGVSSDPLTVAAGESAGTLTLRFGAAVRGPFTAPALVRATLMDDGKPVVAEVPVEVVVP